MWNNRNKSLKLALRGMKWIDLRNWPYFSYCETIKQEFNFLQINYKVCQNYGNIETLIFKDKYDQIDHNFLSPSRKNSDLGKISPREEKFC